MLTGETPFKEIDWQFDDSNEPDVYEDEQSRREHIKKLLASIEDEGEIGLSS